MSSTRASAGFRRVLRAHFAAASAPRPVPETRSGRDLLRARFSRGASTSGAEFDAASRAPGSGPGASTSSETTAAERDASTAPLYPGHVRLTLAQKALLAVTSGVGASLFPERADLVGAANETTAFFALRAARDRMRSDEAGRRILRDRPRITDATLERARACAPGTLGNAWATFMDARKFDPRDRPQVRFVDDEELAYVAARWREVHDIWHVLFECPTTVQGELALKALEFAQTAAPAPALAALVASARLAGDDRRFLFDRLVPWARSAGTRAADLVCLEYEKELDADLRELRMRWRIDVAPKPKPDPSSG